MKAIVITTPGGPEVLQLREIPEPVAGPDDLLVRVRAAGLNRADLLQLGIDGVLATCCDLPALGPATVSHQAIRCPCSPASLIPSLCREEPGTEKREKNNWQGAKLEQEEEEPRVLLV